MPRGTTRASDRLTVDLMARLELAKIADRMRAARIEAGLTQDELKDILKVHKHTVENCENNRQLHGPYRYVNAWAEATGRSVEWLLHGREIVNAPDVDVLAPLLEEVAEVLEQIRPLLAELQHERADRPPASPPREGRA